MASSNNSNECSIVEYFGEHEKSSCGYCGSAEKHYDYGMWLHVVSPEDYQALIDRGWRRCGYYCYKSVISKTACPLYTISCTAVKFELTKSQKRVIKRVNTFLKTGDKKRCASGSVGNGARASEMKEMEYEVDAPDIKVKLCDSVSPPTAESTDCAATAPKKPKVCKEDNTVSDLAIRRGKFSYEALLKTGAFVLDENTSTCRKSKIRRLAYRRKKMLDAGLTEEEILAKFSKPIKIPKKKTLEEHLNEYKTDGAAHSLEVNLVLQTPHNPNYEQYFEEEHRVYVRYQQAVHKEDPSECPPKSYKRFLVDSPIEPQRILSENNDTLPVKHYGSYHQHYRLDGKLIAVAVMDILPKCISSVYFFYDPDYEHLSLGTYSCLKEIELVRKFSKCVPEMRYYYLGLYLHSCPKMRYKAKFKPSFLLCPETFTWEPVQKCVEKLNDVAVCTRFNDDQNAVDDDRCVDIHKVCIAYQNIALTFRRYKQIVGHLEEGQIQEIQQYANLVGQKCANRMYLCRK